MCGGLFGLVALWGWEIGPIPFDGLAIDFALDSDQRVEELVGDIGEDGGAARGDAVLHYQNKELGEELIDLLCGLEIVELGSRNRQRDRRRQVAPVVLAMRHGESKGRNAVRAGGSDVRVR